MHKRSTKKVKWEEMFPDELYEKIQQEPVCYLAYGLAEPHGTYNAIGLDWLKAYNLVLRAAQKFGGVVAPPFAWHIQERPDFHDDGKGNGWLPAAGVKQSLCSSIPTDLFYRIVLHQIRDVDARGFHAAILVTGHYGGLEKIMRLLGEYYVKKSRSPLKYYAIADWECIRHENYRGDHAGICETSQLMALCPDLVNLKRKTVPEELGTRYAGQKKADFKNKRKPSKELGEKIVQSQIDELGRVAKQLLSEYKPNSDWQTPSQRDVDDIWYRFERLTGRYWNTNYSEFKNGVQFSDFPGWEALGEYFD